MALLVCIFTLYSMAERTVVTWNAFISIFPSLQATYICCLTYHAFLNNIKIEKIRENPKTSFSLPPSNVISRNEEATGKTSNTGDDG